jgi:hypothetical protein
MPLYRSTVLVVSAALTIAASALVGAPQVPAFAGGFGGRGPAQRPMEPIRNSGQSITGAYEGWYQNQDGTFTMLVGYMNRNLKQTLDIPVGPNNRIEPEGPDRGQPTHFLPRRQWGVFTITVPKDFGDRKLTWTVIANDQTTVIPLSLNSLWNIDPFRHAMGNTPPKLMFEPGGRGQQGPPRGISASYTTKLTEPLTMRVWVTDDGLTSEGQPVGAGRGGAGRGGAARGGAGRGAAAGPGGGVPPLSLTWSKFRGPGTVAFDKAKTDIDGTDGNVTTIATFSDPGDYLLRVQANDASGEGGGGFQCCWTNVHVKVTVTPSEAAPSPASDPSPAGSTCC